MQLKPRIILLITICCLSLLMALWIDDLYLKTSSFVTYKYELFKILFHSALAYKFSKFLIKKFNLTNKFKSINPKSFFLIVFLLFNSYLICQYTSRTISNRIVCSKSRAAIAKKTDKLGPAGWGFECDSLTYIQFKEITKYTSLPDIPAESKFIYVYDWSEFDFRRIIKFSLRKNYPIEEFYKKQPKFEKNIIIIETEYDKKTHKLIKHENSNFDRYKWEVGES